MTELERRIINVVHRYRVNTGKTVRAVYLPASTYRALEQSLADTHVAMIEADQAIPMATNAIRAKPRQDRIVFPHGFVVLPAVNLTSRWAFLRPLDGSTYHFPLSEIL